MSKHATLNIHEEYKPNFELSSSGLSPDGTQCFGEAAIDIIAVQGLGSSYEWTWSVQSPSDPQERYYWLKQSLPQDLPNARVLAFEYDTKWFGDPDKVTLEECGARLLRCVIQDRTHRGAAQMCPSRRKRPLILMGHSFGGLVIKQALVLASQTGPAHPSYQNHQFFLSSVGAVIFLGTPHRGSMFGRLADWKIRLGRLGNIAACDDLLKILQLDSQLLGYIQNEFERSQKQSTLTELEVYCFYETKQQRIGGWNLGYVVTQKSACLDGAETCGLEADHMGLNKFLPQDKNYDAVKKYIVSAYSSCRPAITRRFNSKQYTSIGASKELKGLKKWLGPSTGAQKRQLEARYADQQRTVSTYATCQWVEQLDVFRQWSSGLNINNVLWVHGKPGCGKSVLAAYLIKLLREDLSESKSPQIPRNCDLPTTLPACEMLGEKPNVLYFFCGVEPSREYPENLIGTLVNQLLSHHPENLKLQSAAIHLASSPESNEGAQATQLTKLLIDCIAMVGQIYIIIDGLEENSHWKGCIEALAPIASCPGIRLAVFCQPATDVNKRLTETFPSIMSFDITMYSKEDIDQFIAAKTSELIRSKPALESREAAIIKHLRQEAAGMFLWVNSCMESLEDELVSASDVDKSLHSLHPGLNPTYRRVFDRLLNNKNDYEQRRIRFALMWLSVSGRQLRAVDLWTAIKLEEEDADIDDVLQASHTERDASSAAHIKRLMGSSVECLPDPNGHTYVQLFHTSLKSFLVRSTSGADAPPSIFAFDLEDAHAMLAKTCMLICSHSGTQLSDGSRPLSGAPLVTYSWDFWAFHFKLSTRELNDHLLLQTFNQMLLFVSGDILDFLLFLSDYVTAPIVPPAIKDQLEYVSAFQKAQKCLVRPIRDLSKLRSRLPLATSLQEARNQTIGRLIDFNGSVEGIQDEEKPNLKGKDSARQRISQIERLYVDEISENEAWVPKDEPLETRAINTIARDLRLVTAMFAVSPVYDDLPDQKPDQTTAAMLFLSNVSNLMESVGSYPYWSGLPDCRDPEEPFLITEKSDEYYGPAAFVLYRLEHYENQQLHHEMKHMLGWEAIHKRYVQPSNGIPISRWFAATVAYRLNSQPTNGFGQTFIINPMHSAHMRYFMHLDIPGAGYFAPAVRHLSQYMPDESKLTPKAFIQALPAILHVFHVNFVEKLVQSIGGRWAWSLLNFQLMRLQLVKLRVKTFLGVWKRVGKPNSGTNYVHCALGLALYLVRIKYFPAFGAHLFPNALHDLRSAYTEPLELLKERIGWTWTGYIIYNVKLHSGNAGFALAVKLIHAEELLVSAIANTYYCFWMLTYLERGWATVANVVSTPVAYISILLGSQESLRELLRYTMTFWLRVIIYIVQTILQLGLVSIIGPWVLLVIFILNGFFIWYIMTFEERFITFLARICYIIVSPLWVISRAAVYTFLPVLKVCATVVAVLVLFNGVSSFSAYVNDPLGLQDSAGALRRTAAAARKSLQESGGLRYRNTVEHRSARAITLPRIPKRGVGHLKDD